MAWYKGTTIFFILALLSTGLFVLGIVFDETIHECPVGKMVTDNLNNPVACQTSDGFYEVNSYNNNWYLAIVFGFFGMVVFWIVCILDWSA